MQGALEAIGVRVPTSCRKNGKCKECIVEVGEGMSLLSAPTPAESHLRDNFRLSCQCTIVADAGEVKCHTMRRGAMRIERHALGLPTTGRKIPLEPCVTREGADRILLDGVEIERSTAPIHGVAMDIGTTTVVCNGKALAFGHPFAFQGETFLGANHADAITIHQRDAVLWVDRAAVHSSEPSKVIVYLENDVAIDFARTGDANAVSGRAAQTLLIRPREV